MAWIGRSKSILAPSALAVSWLCSSSGRAAEVPAPAAQRPATSAAPEDRFTLVGQSETYIQLYQRALLPGQNGASVPTETLVPIHEYLTASARDVDAPWQKDAIRLEFAAWARVWPTRSSMERPFDGDVQAASVRLQAGPAWAALGRQQLAGGAARFVRFDGVRLGVQQQGFFAEGYGGFSVLPRWDEQPGYHKLADAEDDLLVYQPPAPRREEQWLLGARAGYASLPVSASLSFHEQRRDAELDRRNLGLDVSARAFASASLGGNALLELDSERFASARLWLDAAPHPRVDVGVEALHTEPALLLSRQSVLSVFSSSGYEEVGSTLTVRALRWLRLEANGYLDLYDGGGPGARGQLAARFNLDPLQPTLARLAYSRVIAPQNGYNSLRLSLSRQLSHGLGATLEAYGYFYDAPVAGSSTSVLGAGTVSYRVSDPFEVLWSGSLAHSPYASLDAQTLLRASYRFDLPSRARPR
jgi:hypothetical protein